MLLQGGVLYVITEVDGTPVVRAYRPGATDPTLSPFSGTFDGLRLPLALASGLYGDQRYLYVADARGAEDLDLLQDCGEGLSGCSMRFETVAGGSPNEIKSRVIPALEDTTVIRYGYRIDALADGARSSVLFGSAHGHIGIYLEVQDSLLKALRTDGFPADSLAFAFGDWHEIEIVYDHAEAVYAVSVNGDLLGDEIPVYHPLLAPIERIGLRHSADESSGAIDELVITYPNPDQELGAPAAPRPDSLLLLHLAFENDAEIEDGWETGPFFRTEPSPIVYRYLAREDGGPIQSFTNPKWRSIGGITVDSDLTLYIAVQVPDPSDPSGVVLRGEVHRFGRTGDPMDPLSESGTGLGFVVDPLDLYFDTEDLLVVDRSQGRVAKLDIDLPNTGLFQIPPLGSPEALFANPADVVSDVNRYIYVADTDNHRVLRFDPSGAFADTVLSLTFPDDDGVGEILSPFAIEADEDEVWIADRAGGRVVILKYVGQVSGGSE